MPKHFVVEAYIVDKIYKAFYCFRTFHNALDSWYSMKTVLFFFERTGVLRWFSALQLSIRKQTNNTLSLQKIDSVYKS